MTTARVEIPPKLVLMFSQPGARTGIAEHRRRSRVGQVVYFRKDGGDLGYVEKLCIPVHT